MNREAWSEYWQHGSMHSYGSAFGGNYADRMLATWLSWFALLPEQACLVDIGSGNGALLLLAKQFAEQKSKAFSLHGIDYAAIAPEQSVSGGEALFGGVQFHANTSATALPFITASVDAVSAQFALEYMDIPSVLLEVHRVAKPGAHVQFMMHHPESIFVTTGKYELAAIELLHETTFIAKAEAMFIALMSFQGFDHPSSRDSMRDELNAAADRLAEYANQSDRVTDIDSTLQSVSTIWQQRESLGVEGVKHSLTKLAETVDSHGERLRDLQAAVQKPQQMDELVTLMQSIGFGGVQYTELKHETGPVLGWVVRAVVE